jgi:cell filamentation protein
MSDEIYCYPPNFNVLRNKFGIRDAVELAKTEREYTSWRIRQGCPTGSFDLNHLRAIHNHIFQDVYDWAGGVRTLELSKGGSVFMPRQFIENGMSDVQKRVRKADYFRGSTPKDFSERAGEIIGDINHVHPFREGNGRTQLQYLSQLAEKAGHSIDLRKIEPKPWVKASIEANHGRYADMQVCIAGALEHRKKSRAEDRERILRNLRVNKGSASTQLKGKSSERERD